MNKLPFFLLLLCISILSFSQTTINKQDSVNKQPPTAPKDRNMFGLYIPRGLKINSDGLAVGYILFSVPNSALVYLLNRKGEVVDQSKRNYGVTHAYLQDDGSLFQGGMDPHLPVFGSCGIYGRIQKISWDGKML